MGKRIPRVFAICLSALTAVLAGGVPTISGTPQFIFQNPKLESEWPTTPSGAPQLNSQKPNLDPEWNLKHHCPDLSVLRDSKGKIMWFSHEQMKQMAIARVAPVMPAQAQFARVEAEVVLNLCVDTGGLPHNVWALSGHPLLISSAIVAASKWRFKPYKVKSQPIAFAGTLAFTFSTSKGNSY